MKKNVNEALDNIDAVYDELIVIANDIVNNAIGDMNQMLQSTYNNIENLSNEDIRGLILKVSLRSYNFSEIKDKALFKSELAETLRKEAHAIAFGSAEGTATAKENQAVLNTSSEILAEEVYDLVANMFKTKSDELHRVVDAAKTVLMSRMAEAKLTQNEVL